MKIGTPLNISLIVVGIVIIGGWLGLYLTSKAILISQTGPVAPSGTAAIVPGAEVLRCRYFTGSGIIEQEQLHTSGGVVEKEVGKQSCPRMINL